MNRRTDGRTSVPKVFDVWRSLLNVLNELSRASSQLCLMYDGDPGAWNDILSFTNTASKISQVDIKYSTLQQIASMKDWHKWLHCTVSRDPGSKFTKFRKKCQLARPLTMPDFIVLDQTMYEKSVTKFLHPSVFWRPRGHPVPNFTNLGNAI